MLLPRLGPFSDRRPPDYDCSPEADILYVYIYRFSKHGNHRHEISTYRLYCRLYRVFYRRCKHCALRLIKRGSRARRASRKPTNDYAKRHFLGSLFRRLNAPIGWMDNNLRAPILCGPYRPIYIFRPTKSRRSFAYRLCEIARHETSHWRLVR